MKKYNPVTIRVSSNQATLINEINKNFRLIASAINQSTTRASNVVSNIRSGGSSTTIINNITDGLDYDQAVPTYTGENPTQVIYKRGGNTVATLTLTWDVDDLQVLAIVGEVVRTWTLTYDTQGNFSNIIKS